MTLILGADGNWALAVEPVGVELLMLGANTHTIAVRATIANAPATAIKGEPGRGVVPGSAGVVGDSFGVIDKETGLAP